MKIGFCLSCLGLTLVLFSTFTELVTGRQRLARCANNKTPCGIQYVNTTETRCRCARGNRCSASWNDTSHVIQVQRSASLPPFKLKFCRALSRPRRNCRSPKKNKYDIAAIFKGQIFLYPLKKLKCNCEDGKPIVLWRMAKSGSKTVFKYICSSHMRTCARRSEICERRQHDPSQTTFSCACPEGQRCHRERRYNNRSVFRCAP